MDTDKVIHSELSEAIIGAAMKVLNTLKPGLNEKAYENALAVELGRRGLRVQQQRRFDVIYEGVVVDTLVPDLIVKTRLSSIPRSRKILPRHISLR